MRTSYEKLSALYSFTYPQFDTFEVTVRKKNNLILFKLVEGCFKIYKLILKKSNIIFSFITRHPICQLCKTRLFNSFYSEY